MRNSVNITIQLGGEILKQSLEHSENLGLTLKEYVKKSNYNKYIINKF